MKKPQRRLTFWNYWLAWISVNAIAWTVAFGLAQLYARLLYPNDRFIRLILEDVNYIWTRPLESPLATTNYGLLLGAVIGIGQWYVLRRRLDIKWTWWLAATMLGFAIHGLTLGLDVSLLNGGQAGLAGEIGGEQALRSVGLLCGGVVLVGIPQWLVLRQHLPKAGWWILISAAALLLASPDRSGGAGSLVGWIAVSMGAGAVYGIVTAFGLFFLLPQPQPQDEEESDA
jgi:hypothetical protein